MRFNDYKKEIREIKKSKTPEWVVDFDFDTCHLISEARLKAGLTQGQLAKLIGTQQPSIARVENGSVLPGNNFLKRVAIAIGTTLIPPRFGFMEKIEQIQQTSDSQTVNNLFLMQTPFMFGINTQNSQLENSIT